jgi:hypothetical protein
MGRKKLDTFGLSQKQWADPTEISDDDLERFQGAFTKNVVEVIDAMKEECKDGEHIIGVLVSVVTLDKARSDEEATRYTAGAACVMPNEWSKYEPAVMAAGTKCMVSLAESVLDPTPDEPEDTGFQQPDIIRLRETNIKRVEDLFELFSEECLENVPVMFPGVVADDMFSRAKFTSEANVYWPIVQEITENQRMPALSEDLADHLLSSWDDDTSLMVQALLYVAMNLGPLDELDLKDPALELCHVVCKQMQDDLETIILGAPDALNA